MAVEFKKADDKTSWEQFNKNSKFGYFLQSWNWGELQKEWGKSISRYEIIVDGNRKGILQTITEKSRFGNICYIPRGPVIDWEDKKLIKKVTNAMKDFFKDQGFLILRFDPEIEKESSQASLLKELGFKSGVLTVQAENPWIIDIDGRSDSELFEWMSEHDMRSKVPNYIRGSRRKGCEVRVVESHDGLELFLEMLTDMARAKDINLGNPDYIQKMYEVLDGSFKVFIGYYEDKPVVSAGIIMYGNEAAYLYGASTPDIGNTNAAYLLQWEVIKHARDLDIKRYNLWGVLVDEEYKKGNPGYGYSYFKRSFGGYAKRLIKPLEYPYKKLTYKLVRLQQRYRKYKLRKQGYL